MALDKVVLEKAKYWSTSTAFDNSVRKEIQSLLDDNDENELTDRFYKDLEFGTGGLRGILGAGTSRMNIYNVRKATTALALHLKETFTSAKEIKVAISHDSRHFSRDFAKTAAETLAAHNIVALITKELRPTPMLSFMTRYFNCHAGICVTASHNPKQYNGYKVYWQTGAQVVPPHDEAIIDHYNKLNNYEDLKLLPYDEAKQKKLIVEIGEELDIPYFAEVEKLSLHKEGRENFKIAFTPLHGTAAYPINESLKRYGFKHVYTVAEQREPNGDFPTVKFPNPEDPAALDLAIKLAKKENADLVLGTDPDCDRIGIVYKDKNNEYVVVNGNQIGSLLIEYMLSSMKELNKLPKNPLVIKTVVTSDLQKQIAEYYGASCEDTLTGFKWICQLIENYETGKLTPRKEYVCGGEESYGFLAGSFVRDKDAVSACSLAAEMTAYYKTKGKTLGDVLDDIFKRHGVYQETLHTITMPGKEGSEKINEIMVNLRKNPPRNIDGVLVKKLIDIEYSQEFSVTETGLNKIGTVTLPRSNVLQFLLEDGTKISARPSGTEPKIKFYVSVREPIKNDTSDTAIHKLKQRCEERAVRIQEVFVNLTK